MTAKEAIQNEIAELKKKEAELADQLNKLRLDIRRLERARKVIEPKEE